MRNCQVLVAILLARQINKVCVEEKEEDDTFGLVCIRDASNGILSAEIWSQLLEHSHSDVAPHTNTFKGDGRDGGFHRRCFKSEPRDIFTSALNEGLQTLHLVSERKKSCLKFQAVQSNLWLGAGWNRGASVQPGVVGRQVAPQLSNVSDLRWRLHSTDLALRGVSPLLGKEFHGTLRRTSYLGVHHPGTAKGSSTPLASLAVHCNGLALVTDVELSYIYQEFQELFHVGRCMVLNVEVHHRAANFLELLVRVGTLWASIVHAEMPVVFDLEEPDNLIQRISVKSLPGVLDWKCHGYQIWCNVSKVQVEVVV
mmetsp:Transcript_37610/g.100018  ORF Transcript_37610/g.100018 Transcript_37610/m.100018 type:complete len:312 (-) Transcript_37610:678-1613(-)